MSISPLLRQQVRIRAGCACEFCDVSEVDAGGTLTVDHFHPQSKGGTDTLDNLVYCCITCNQFKQDYWATPTQTPLWNPRQESASIHFLELENGHLLPLTPTGEWTIKRLRLNRALLVAHRLNRHRRAEEGKLLEQQKDVIEVLRQLNQQLSDLTAQQQRLLQEQQQILLFLLGRSNL
jgi:hypothetical protein